MIKFEYREYLESLYWRTRRRNKILSAAVPGTCEDCGGWYDPRDWRELQVHHLTYDRVPYDEFDSDLMVLCATCHTNTHGLSAVSTAEQQERIDADREYQRQLERETQYEAELRDSEADPSTPH